MTFSSRGAAGSSLTEAADLHCAAADAVMRIVRQFVYRS